MDMYLSGCKKKLLPKVLFCLASVNCISTLFDEMAFFFAEWKIANEEFVREIR